MLLLTGRIAGFLLERENGKSVSNSPPNARRAEVSSHLLFQVKYLAGAG